MEKIEESEFLWGSDLTVWKNANTGNSQMENSYYALFSSLWSHKVGPRLITSLMCTSLDIHWEEKIQYIMYMVFFSMIHWSVRWYFSWREMEKRGFIGFFISLNAILRGILTLKIKIIHYSCISFYSIEYIISYCPLDVAP